MTNVPGSVFVKYTTVSSAYTVFDLSTACALRFYKKNLKKKIVVKYVPTFSKSTVKTYTKSTLKKKKERRVKNLSNDDHATFLLLFFFLHFY